jgi:hypothetical protein
MDASTLVDTEANGYQVLGVTVTAGTDAEAVTWWSKFSWRIKQRWKNTNNY